MASIEDRNGSVRVIVSCGRDIYGKKIRESATFVPDPDLTPKKRQKAIEDFARQFEAQASTTMNIYAHALQETDRKAAAALENMLVKHA